MSRIESSTGIYHVMLRGINRQSIFQGEDDFEWFKICLKKTKESSGLKIMAYCLMDNHVHIVAKAGSEPIGVSIKRLGVRYVSWYNRKYNRQGTLFQDRYKSQPVQDESYLLALVRYVHQNSVKAGICGDIAEYPWSSFFDYIGKGDSLSDTEEILGYFSSNASEQRKLFVEFAREIGNEEFADVIDRPYISDSAIREKIADICGAGSLEEFQALSHDKQSHAILSMRKCGISMRKIARNTGVPLGAVRGLSEKEA